VSTDSGSTPNPPSEPTSDSTSGGASAEQAGYSGLVVESDDLTPQQKQELLSTIAHSWWLVLGLGVVSVIVGGLVLWAPFATVRVAAIIFGLWLLIGGIFRLAQSLDQQLDTTGRVVSAISGVVGIVLGIVCFQSVEDRVSLLVLFIGIWWILSGLMQLITSAGGRGEPSDGFGIFLGLLGILAGIVVLVWPIGSLSVLVVVAGIWLLVLGLVQILVAFRVRSLANRTVSG